MYCSTFNSQELGLFTAVLDQVCIDLRVIDDAYRDSIGKRIMFKAQMGERRFQVLAKYAHQGGLPELFRSAGNNSNDILVPYRYQFSMIDPAGHAVD